MPDLIMCSCRPHSTELCSLSEHNYFQQDRLEAALLLTILVKSIMFTPTTPFHTGLAFCVTSMERPQNQKGALVSGDLNHIMHITSKNAASSRTQPKKLRSAVNIISSYTA